MYEFIELLAALICPRLKFLALLAYGRMFSVLIENDSKIYQIYFYFNFRKENKLIKYKNNHS